MIIRAVENFFDSWSPDMAYVLGYFSADGCMYKNPRGSKYIAFYSGDLELIESVKKIMNVPNRIEMRLRKVGYKMSYCIQIGGNHLYFRLLELGLTPNKSLTLKFPKIPNDLFCHFLRGFFDGDGNAYFGKTHKKDRKNPSYFCLFRLTSGSKTFLEDVRNRINLNLNISVGNIYPKKGGFDLAYSSRVVLKLYSFIYPSLNVPHLERKRLVLEKYIKRLRP